MKQAIRSKQDMISAIGIFLTEMETECVGAGLKPNQMSLPEGCLFLDMNDVRDGFKWVKAIYIDEFEEIVQVRRLLTPNLWTRYEEWDDFQDLREMQMLTDARERLRKIINSNDRPAFFKKGKICAKIKKLQRAKEAAA